MNILNNHTDSVDSYCICFNNDGHTHNMPTCQTDEGIVLCSFADETDRFKQMCRHVYRNYDSSDDILKKFDAMSGNNGFLLFVPANVTPFKPIHVTCLFDESYKAPIQLHNMIIMEKGSSAELLISFRTSNTFLAAESVEIEVHDTTEIVLGKSAALNMVYLQKLDSSARLITETCVQQATLSRMKTHFVTIGGASVVNNMEVKLAGPHSEHAAFGLAVTQECEQADNNIVIVHASPDCQSNQLFKHILSDTSTGAFTGRIVVDMNACRTVAYQRSNNILLHPKAKIDVRPELEIYADDVKCSHGTTVGQLDAEVLFYMRSRGIGEREAKKMMLHAFAGEVLNHVSFEPFREYLLQMMPSE